MANKVLITTAVMSFIFAALGGVILGFSVIVAGVRSTVSPPDGIEAARNLIYQEFPLQAGIANAIMMFIAFVILIPGLVTPARTTLKIGVVAVVLCGLFTMCIGLFIWVITLSTKEAFFPIWKQQPSVIQAQMEDSFACCGFFNSSSPAFVTTQTCPSPAAAAVVRGCGGPISAFANELLDDIFTAVFGVVGIDALLVLSIACLLKDRKERERYRHIDEKSGYQTF